MHRGGRACFRLYGEGRTEPPGVLGHHTCDAGFHIKAASLELGRNYFAAKTNGNFSRNPERFGLPAILADEDEC